MKKLIILCLLITLTYLRLLGQVTEKFNYQGVLRNTTGELVKNTSITVKISLLQASATGELKYSENHSIITNDYGQFNVQVGAGTLLFGSFSGIDWSKEMYLKTEIANPSDGTIIDMGTVQLLSVPYALYAKNVENNDDADANPTNELQSLTLIGDTLKISNGNNVIFPYDSSQWAANGNKLYYNTGNVGIGTNDPSSKLEVKSSGTTGALFQVINANNDTVFAVYPDGVKVFVDPETKGTVGGFAVSGRTPAKAGVKVDYFRVTPDSTRIYVNDSIVAKGSVGGFAVSGRTPAKGGTIEYFSINKDSTRIYINDSSTTKGKVGGFAVSGRTPSKQGETKDYFNISGNSELDSIGSETRILWYPAKAAFLAGEVHIGSADSVGTNSTSLGYRTIAMGNYSQAMGYKAQSLGLNSTAIGNNAIANSNNSFAFGNYAQTQGVNSFAFGDSAISNGDESYALGSHAKALGKNSFAMGSFGIDADNFLTGPTVASGDYSYAFGMGSIASGLISLAFGGINNASGVHSIAIGYGTTSSAINSIAIGLKNTASGPSSFALGNYTVASGVFSTTLGNGTVASGEDATAMGENTYAFGDNSIAMGRAAFATAENSVAIGLGINASGNKSFVLGCYSYATAESSVAIGLGDTASAYSSIVLGYYSNAKGNYSVAIGNTTTAIGESSTSMGNNTKAKYNNSLSIGAFNDTSSYTGSKPLFIVGNGTANNARSNALTLLDNGCLGLGVLVPTYRIQLDNNSSDAVGKGLAFTWSTYSDSRIKKDQKTINYGLKELMQLRPMSYNHFSSNFNQGKLNLLNDSVKTIGFIAQDVYSIIPEAVNKPIDETQELWTINYEKLSPVVVKAIQEQQDQIDKLSHENDQLKRQLNEITKRLEKLEK